MEEKKKGGKRAAPNRRGWLLAVLVGMFQGGIQALSEMLSDLENALL